MPGGNLEGVDDVRVLPVRVEGMTVGRGPDLSVDLHFIKTQIGRNKLQAPHQQSERLQHGHQVQPRLIIISVQAQIDSQVWQAQGDTCNWSQDDVEVVVRRGS